MTDADSSTVTIQKAYFEALLRRAEFHASGNEDNVTISKVDYESLVRHASQYNLLCQALYRGGLEPETLETLLEGGTQDQSFGNQDVNRWSSLFERPTHKPITITSPQHAKRSAPPPAHRNARAPHQRRHGYASPANTTPEKDSESLAQNRDEHRRYQQQDQAIPQHAKRTVFISGLADNVTLRDLAKNIRGGSLVELYIRNDRSAIVSFVEGAEDFVSYATKNDIHINGKKIDVKWNERQFQLAAHIANKVSIGATRNLLIRGGVGKLTEHAIREDMEHIHNLEILDVKFKDADVYISTNSIYNALFARTCMMSRLPYKGLKVEWYPDECAAKPRVSSYSVPRSVSKAPVKAVPALTNRYNLLSMDVGGSESESTDSDHVETLSGYGVDLSSNWADMSSVA